MNDTTCIRPHSGQRKGATSYTRLINIAHVWLLPVATLGFPIASVCCGTTTQVTRLLT